jgi:hypothetical protein
MYSNQFCVAFGIKYLLSGTRRSSSAADQYKSDLITARCMSCSSDTGGASPAVATEPVLRNPRRFKEFDSMLSPC